MQINHTQNLSLIHSPFWYLPSAPQKVPAPSRLPFRKWPSKRSPFTQRQIPLPCRSSLLNPPSYTSLFANLRMPIPCFMPLLQSPSYSAPERKQQRPQPLISSSMKQPEYFSPDWQQQSPHPLFMPYYIYPQQTSPFLYLMRNRLFPKSVFSIYQYSESTYYELFVNSYCSTGTGQRISSYSAYFSYFLGECLISSWGGTSDFSAETTTNSLFFSFSWPKKVLQLILVLLKNASAYQLNSSSPIQSLIFKIY